MTEPLEDLPRFDLEDFLKTFMHDCEKLAKRDVMFDPLSTMYRDLRRRLGEIDPLLFREHSHDAVILAKRQIAKQELEEFTRKARLLAANAMVDGLYTGLGYLKGSLVLIPRNDWTGTIDWAEDSLQADGRLYRHVRFLPYDLLTPEQKDLVRRRSGRAVNQPATVPVNKFVANHTERGPGRPSSKMQIIAQYQVMRDERQLGASKTALCKRLTEWHNHTYLPDLSEDSKPIKYSTVMKHIGTLFWNDTRRKPPNSRK